MILNSIVKTHFISLHIIKTKRHCYFFKAIGRKEDTENSLFLRVSQYSISNTIRFTKASFKHKLNLQTSSFYFPNHTLFSEDYIRF